MLSRRERRENARKEGVPFEPVYNSSERTIKTGKDGKVTVGGAPKSYEEMHGVGYERFNNKYITIKEVEVKEDDK